MKHPQTIGKVEKAHATLNETCETFIHNTYHTSIGCAPTVIFHGRDPVKPLDIHFYSNCMPNLPSTTTFWNHYVMKCLKKSKIWKKASQNLPTDTAVTTTEKHGQIHLLHKHIVYCWTLKSASSPKLIQKWLALYKVLTDSNYLIKGRTNYTQIVHRLRLRPIKSRYQSTGIDGINSNNFQINPTLWDIIEANKTSEKAFLLFWIKIESYRKRKPRTWTVQSECQFLLEVQPQQPPAAEEIVNHFDPAFVIAGPITINQALWPEQPRRKLHHHRTPQRNYLNLQKSLVNTLKLLLHQDAQQGYKNIEWVG